MHLKNGYFVVNDAFLLKISKVNFTQAWSNTHQMHIAVGHASLIQ